MTGSEAEVVAPSGVADPGGVRANRQIDHAVLSLDDHLRIIRDWQSEFGKFGKCPPKAGFPKTSNFVQWARKRVRDSGDSKYAKALASVGIEAAKVRPGAGLAASCSAISGFVKDSGRVPDLDSVDKGERQRAAWLIRIQAGILPRNHLEARADGPVSQLMQGVVAMLETQQSNTRMAAQWFDFCVRTHDIIPRLHKGNTWGSRLAEAQPDRIAQQYPWLRAAKRSMAPRRTTHVVCAPDPVVVISDLNAALEVLDCPVSFSTDRDATAVFRTRLVWCGLLETGLGIQEWIGRKALRR